MRTDKKKTGNWRGHHRRSRPNRRRKRRANHASSQTTAQHDKSHYHASGSHNSPPWINSLKLSQGTLGTRASTGQPPYDKCPQASHTIVTTGVPARTLHSKTGNLPVDLPSVRWKAAMLTLGLPRASRSGSASATRSSRSRCSASPDAGPHSRPKQPTAQSVEPYSWSLHGQG